MSEVNLKEDFKSPWFLAILALIGIALAGTVWMAMIAGDTSPGLVTENYYEKGKNYFNRTPEDSGPLQLRINLLPPQQSVAGQPQRYRLYALDASGSPLSEGSATLFAFRPSDAAADFSVKMKLVDRGTFIADITFPLPGSWDLIAEVKRGEEKADIAQRHFVRR